MEEELSYPYRRFSNELYAESLIVLLEEHHFPFDVVNEPEGAGSVFLGSAAIPGVIVMVKPSDALTIRSLEQKEVPDEIPEVSAEPDKINPGWLVIGYLMMILMYPAGIIFGLHLMSAHRRQPDMSDGFAYSRETRNHGKVIFGTSLFLLLFGLIQITLFQASFIRSMSHVIYWFTRYR